MNQQLIIKFVQKCGATEILADAIDINCNSGNIIFENIEHLDKFAELISQANKQDTAWLVEKTVGGYPHYLYVSCNGLFDWTPANSKAMRFSRREDADMICNVIEDAEKVAEHLWSDKE